MKILLAIDDSTSSAAAIQVVIDLFRPAGSEVWVLHAIEWPKGAPVSYSFAEGPEATHGILALREEMRRAGEALVADAARRLKAAAFQVSADVRAGDARHVILDGAGEWLADLIVVGSHGRRGLDRLLLGSVSESVVRHATCSVQVVRPSRPPAASS